MHKKHHERVGTSQVLLGRTLVALGVVWLAIALLGSTLGLWAGLPSLDSWWEPPVTSTLTR